MIMKYFFVFFVLIFVIFSCKPKTEHQFIYGFENPKDISEENIIKTIDILKKRLQAYGISAEIKVFASDKIRIKIYSEKIKKEALDKLVTNSGRLEFWHTYEAKELFYYIAAIDKELMSNESKVDSTKTISVLNSINSTGYGSIAGYLKPEDTTGILKALNTNKHLLEPKHKFVKFLYGKPEKYSNAIALYFINGNRENLSELTGEVVTMSGQDYDLRNEPVISLEMNQKGAVRWEIMTEKAYNQKTQIAIVINDVVMSAPGVSMGAIKGGRTQISGDFTQQEAIELASVFSGGGEIAPLKLLNYTKVTDK